MSPSAYQQSVTFTATISTANGNGDLRPRRRLLDRNGNNQWFNCDPHNFFVDCWLALHHRGMGRQFELQLYHFSSDRPNSESGHAPNHVVESLHRLPMASHWSSTHIECDGERPRLIPPTARLLELFFLQGCILFRQRLRRRMRSTTRSATTTVTLTVSMAPNSGIIVTIAGDATRVSRATAARRISRKLSNPVGVAIDSSGMVYFCRQQ